MNGLRLIGAVLLLALGLGLSAGCSSSKVDWNGRIGTYSQDDAVRELGPPDKSAKLTDGSTVSDWMTARSSAPSTVYAPGMGRYGRMGWAGPQYVVVDPPGPDRYLRLTFDSQGKLASWQKVYK